jgi:hypothetical protein
MDVLFGAITQEQRDADIARHAAGNAKVNEMEDNEKAELAGEQMRVERV